MTTTSLPRKDVSPLLPEALGGILEMLSAGVLAISAEGRVWFVNQAAKRILGDGDATRAGPSQWTSVYGWYLPDQSTLLAPHELPVARALRGEEIRDELIFVRNATHPDGVWIRLSASPVLGDAVDIRGAALVFRDVTQPRQFQQTNLLLSQAIEQIADAVLISDQHGFIEYVNPAFQSMTGFSADDVRGKTPRILKSGQQSAAFYQRLWRKLLTGEPFQATLVNRRKDGDLYHVEETITPISDNLGNVTHFISVMQDVTALLDQRDREVQLRLAQQIQQKLNGAVPQIPGFDIAAAVFAASQTSGDSFDFIPEPDGSWVIALGDVEGHGFGSALVMALTRAYVRSFAILGLEVHDILQQVNRMLVDDLGNDCYVTLILARLDPQRHSFIYASAGHVPGYLLRDGEIQITLESSGPPLGLFPNQSYTRSEPVELKLGHLLALVTDGIAESLAPDGRELGAHGVTDYLMAHCRDSASDLVQGFYREARSFAAGQPQADDISAVILKRQPITSLNLVRSPHLQYMAL